MKFQHRHIENCLENEPPFCSADCPFCMDVRDFIGKMRRGAFSAAFKVYRNAVAFTEIVSALCPGHCQHSCPRVEYGGAIDLRLLERAAIDYTEDRRPIAFNVPVKRSRIAVVGAGPSGMACALRLSTKKYQVTVFEKTDRIGGHLWNVLPPELFLKDIKDQFVYEKYELRLNCAVEIDDLKDFDAVYVATGKDSNSLGLKRASTGAFAADRPGFFIGGSSSGCDSVNAIAQGLQSINAIERYIKVGAMTQPEVSHETNMVLDPTLLLTQQAVRPVSGEFFTKEEAVAEAERCFRCSCDACQRHCDLMAYYKKFPPRLSDEVAFTIDPATMDHNGTFAKRLIGTCTQCGACQSICPNKIDMGKFLLESREAMVKKKSLPWAFHDYWLKDMAHAMSDSSRLCMMPNDAANCQYVFFPGCQLGASEQDYVLKSYNWLLSLYPDAGILLGCCGVPAVWACEKELQKEISDWILHSWEQMGKPVFVTACPTCQKTFIDSFKEISVKSIYELFAENELLPKVSGNGESVSIFDPCASRKQKETRDAVKTLVKNAGFTLCPLPKQERDFACCSYGGHGSIANPDFANTIIKKRLSESEAPYIAYCANCRDIYAAEGKACSHVLDLIFDISMGHRKPPTITSRRKNREELKNQVIELLTGEKKALHMKLQEFKLIISDELSEILSERHILEEEIYSVIRECENTKNRIRLDGENHFCGYTKIGRATYWAEYSLIGDEYHLIAGYLHRMEITY